MNMAGSNSNAKVWQDAVSASKECPTLEVLEQVMEESSSDPKAAAHVASCPRCQTEIAMLRSFESSAPSADEGAAVAWIAAQLQRNQQTPPARASATVVPFWRAVFRVPYMAAAAALIVAIALGISMYRSDNGQPGFVFHGAGTTYRGEIHLNAAGELSQPPQQLTWEAVPGASSYSVRIDDITGDKIWQSTSTDNSINVDPELKEKMRPGKPLKWTVRALDANGKELAVGSANFRIAVK
jgi:hypothetical protein